MDAPLRARRSEPVASRGPSQRLGRCRRSRRPVSRSAADDTAAMLPSRAQTKTSGWTTPSSDRATTRTRTATVMTPNSHARRLSPLDAGPSSFSFIAERVDEGTTLSSANSRRRVTRIGGGMTHVRSSRIAADADAQATSIWTRRPSALSVQSETREPVLVAHRAKEGICP
jgi:hypothetical protein